MNAFPANTTSRVHAVALLLVCLASSDSAAATGPIALVLRTHKSTPRVRQAAITARNQIEAAGGYFRICLRTSTQSAGEVNSTLHELRSAVGAQYIEHVATADIERDLPGYIHAVIDFEKKKKRTKPWEWSAADIADYPLYLRMASSLPPWVQHIWWLEYDVGWTGSLASICSTMFDDTSDYIGYNYRSAECNSSHAWAHCHESNWLTPAQTFAALGAIIRVSRRLMDAIILHLKAGQFAFGEATAPSICSGVHQDWCTAYPSFNEHHPAIGRDGPVPLFEWEKRKNVSPEVFARQEEEFARQAALNSTLPGQLYHPLKW